MPKYGASSHTGAQSMGYIYVDIGKNRLIGLRKPAWQEPGVVEHAPRTPDENSCDYFSTFFIETYLMVKLLLSNGEFDGKLKILI